MKFIGKAQDHSYIADGIAGVFQIAYCHLSAYFLLVRSRSDPEITFEYPQRLSNGFAGEMAECGLIEFFLPMRIQIIFHQDRFVGGIAVNCSLQQKHL